MSHLILTNKERIDIVKRQLSPYKIPAEIAKIEDLLLKILDLKKQKNVVILGHNYMSPEIYYGLSDYVGDSLALSKNAKDTTADILLFNGVHFMAETAKILNPNKKVLIADSKAGCSLAESISVQDVQLLRKQYPNVPIVSYINCTAEIKAESDVICTSANAVHIINSFSEDTIIMLPDKYLAHNVQKETKKRIIAWEGKCMVHELFTKEDVEVARRAFPSVKIVAHPECKPEVTAIADFTGSTTQMGKYISQYSTNKILLLTECSMGANLKEEYPKAEFVSTCQNCPHMKKITLEKILFSLENEVEEVFVAEETIYRAQKALNRMLELS